VAAPDRGPLAAPARSPRRRRPHDPGSDEHNLRIGEGPQEPGQPVLDDGHVGVHERNERSAHHGKAQVAGRSRSTVLFESHPLRPVAGRNVGDAVVLSGAVVDHDQSAARIVLADRCETMIQRRRVVPNRDDDRDVLGSVGTSTHPWSGDEDAGVDQPARKAGLPAPGFDIGALGQPRQAGRTALRETEAPQRRAADHHPPAAKGPDTGCELVAHGLRWSSRRRRPARRR
jgi:hypothetical protein